MSMLNDPCDGWQLPATRGYYYPAVRPELVCIEGFTPENATPILAKFLPFVRTDWHRWQSDTSWTLESGPDDAPSCIEIEVPYNYSGGSSDFFAGGCWNPGDSPEVETGTAWFIDDDGVRCEVNLLPAETERVENWIAENPPEPDYGDDW